MVAGPIPVNPADALPDLIIWSSFNLFGAFGNALLLFTSLLFPRKRNNLLLMNVHLVVFVAGVLASTLLLTGHGMSTDVPVGICLFNAAIILANSPVLAGAALALVAKVWSNAMLVYYPTSKILAWTSWTPLLLLIPYIASIPLFVISLVIGFNDHSLLFRGSTFYCTINNESISTASSLLAALYSLLTVILAAWTAAFVLRSHRHVSGGAPRHRIRHHQLVVRVLFFTVLMLVGFIAGIISVFIGFSVNWNDIIVSFAFVWAFLVFASDGEYMNLFFRCQLRPASATTEHTSGGASRTLASAAHIVTRGEPEVLAFPPLRRPQDEESKGCFDDVPLRKLGPPGHFHPYGQAHDNGVWDGQKDAR